MDNDDSSRNNNQRPEKILLENSILSLFPLKNENELLSTEKNLLSEDLGYTNKLVKIICFIYVLNILKPVYIKRNMLIIIGYSVHFCI